MNFEINKVYRFIIEEVIRTIENESDVNGIDSLLVSELKNSWYEKISEYSDLNSVSDMRTVTPIVLQPSKQFDRSDSDEFKSSELDQEDVCENLFMCLYVKVNKSKSKWKCSFKDGFVNIGPLDFAFSTAQGDLLW